MAVFGSNETLITQIESTLKACKSGALELRTYEELLDQTRELYERVLLIRYKAFENHVKKEEISASVETPIVEEKVIVTEENPAEKTEEVAPFSFSLFEEITPKEEVKIEEEQKPEPVVEVIVEPEPIVEITPEPAPVVEKVIPSMPKPLLDFKDEKNSLLDKIHEQQAENSLGSFLEKSPIESLVNAFNLNDRIRFVRELFGGDSDLFNVTIKELDASDSKQMANEKLQSLMQTHEWKIDNEDFIYFSSFIGRRFLND